MVVGARKVLEKGAGFYNVWYAAGCNLACMDEMRLHVSFASLRRFRATYGTEVHHMLVRSITCEHMRSNLFQERN